MIVNEIDDDFEPAYADVPEGEALVVDDVQSEQGAHVRRAAIGITAGVFDDMLILPRTGVAPLLHLIGAEPLPFGGYFGYYENQDVELHRLDIVTPVCNRYWPGVEEFLYGPTSMFESALRAANIEIAPLPLDFMDPFERGLARYAIYKGR